MGTGYVRNDTANSIANGNVIDADALDGEFNAVESAFNAATGHNHDGTAANGTPITKVGPTQDVVVSATTVTPKTTNTVSLGTSVLKFKDAHIDGILYTDDITLNGTAITATAAELNTLDGVTATATEINILDGVTATTAELNVLDGITATVTELNYTDGVTSNIQTQLDNKQPLDADLTAIGALAKTDGNIIVGDGTTWVAESGDTARASLGVSIGSQVQAWDANLDQLAALTPSDNHFVVGNGTAWTAETPADALVSLGVTATGAELNVLDGANLTIAPALLATPQRYLDPENRVINGAFDFWQRGTSHATFGYGSADRWINNMSGGTITMSRQSFTLGDTLGSNIPTYFLRQTVSGQSTSNNYALISQRIEGVRSYAGQTITVLGWARRSSGAGNMAVEITQSFGSGGSPSAAVTGTGQTVALSGSWAPFAVTISLPSVAGKTLGTSGDDRLDLNFWTSAGSIFTARTNSLGLQTIGVDLWGVHIKLGTHTTAAVDLYKQPELGPELARCQRYYFEYTQGVWTTRLYSNSGTLTNHFWKRGFFPVTMRTLPTTTITTPTYSNCSNLGVLPDTAAGWVERVDITAGGTYYLTSYSATFDAEL